MREQSAAVELLQAMADPVRFALLERMTSGPVAVSDLVARTGHSQSKVSNHLALLRRAALGRATKQGRQVLYEVRDPAVVEIMETLLRSARRNVSPQATPALMQARCCYDHLAGRLGVGLFDTLVARKAIADLAVPAATRKVRSGLGPVSLGPAAQPVFGRLGVDIEAARRAKRQFATACLDWTENRPHLGGALGAALLARLQALGWVERVRGTRVVRVSTRGRRGLSELGLQLPG